MKKSIKTAIQIARRYGYNKATAVVVGDDSKIVTAQLYGYRKKTTGQYVPAKYRANFGWKNTYHQHAVCVVMVNIENFY